MSEILEFVFNNEEKTVVKVPNTTKINMSVDGDFQLIEFIPEVEVKKETFIAGEIVKSNLTGRMYRYIGIFGESGSISKTTIDEKNEFLKVENKMIDDNGNIVDWKPKIGEKYFVCNLIEEDFYRLNVFDGDLIDTRIFSRKIAFPTREQAIKKTKELLNIK